MKDSSSPMRWLTGAVVAAVVGVGFLAYVQHVRHEERMATLHAQLRTCRARYEGYNLPAVPRHDDLEQALAALGGRWASLPRFGGSSGSSSKTNVSSMSTTVKHNIPRYIWQTVREAPKKLPTHTREMLGNNSGWHFALMDDTDVDVFMRTVFARTSLLWAYQNINPKLGAMKADIWRYAVLYAFGGVYVDADSCFKLTLDNYLRPDDGYVFSAEHNEYTHCYTPDFYLGQPRFNDKEFVDTLPFGPFKVAQYLLIFQPRHPVLAGALRNIVLVFKHLYLRHNILNTSVVVDWRNGIKGPINEDSPVVKRLLCATGPDFLTATLREVIWRHRNATDGRVLNNGTDRTLHLRSAGVEYDGIRAVFKAVSNNFARKGHWHTELEGGAALLHHYAT
jgi:hypothetical protein